MRTSRITSRFGGAFWALVVAWICAQSPQALVVGIAEWVRGMERFSHRERLVAEVYAAFRGEIRQVEGRVTRAEPPAKTGAEKAALSLGSVEKLLLVLAERDRGNGDVVVEKTFRRPDDWELAICGAVEPPFEPPRV